MFNIFNIFSKTNPEHFTIEYNSYDCFNLVLTKIKPYISKYYDSQIDFNIKNYDSNIQYDNMFDCPDLKKVYC